MKVLLFVPKKYGFYHTFESVFQAWGAQIHPIDPFVVIKDWEKRVNTQIYRLPNNWRVKWEGHFLRKINQYYLNEFQKVSPDLVFVYNNGFLVPETAAYFKNNGAKLAFYLGDNPFYIPHNRHFLPLLFQADAIFAPDTFWIQQLSKIGISNIHHLLTGVPSHQYFEKELTADQRRELGTEVLYVGMCYKNSWGYKKARFLNHFTGTDLQIHGDLSWERWFEEFPDLRPHFRRRTGYFSIEKINEMYNAAKIIPIDGNPGIQNGIHLRAFEALGAGSLPLMEWHQDMDLVFGNGMQLPAVRSYEEIPAMTAFYLENEDKRRTTVEWMRNTLMEKYSIEQNGALLQKALRLDPVHT